MKILVLGGSGFIGRNLIYRLKNEHELIIFSNADNPQIANDFEFVVGDFTNSELVSSILNDVDLVIHMVSATVPSSISYKDDIEINIMGSLQLFDLMVQNDVNKIIYFSSGGAIYGNPINNPVKEDSPLKPISSYAISKMVIERYLELYNRKYGLRSLVIRPSNPYGPGQSVSGSQGVIARVMYQIKNEETISLIGGGRAIRDFIYIDDLIDITQKMINDFKDGIYNVGSGIGYSIESLIRLIEKVSGKNAIVKKIPARPQDVDSIVLDIQKVKNTFNWSPHIPLDIGVSMYWNNF